MKRVGKQVEFLVDSRYGGLKNPEVVIRRQSMIRMSSSHAARVCCSQVRKIKPTMNKSGYLMTGYAPIKDSQGRYVALVGVDMSADRLVNRQKFIGTIVYLILGLAGGFSRVDNTC